MFNINIISKWANDTPENIAFKDEIYSLNFAELELMVKKTATLLSNYGVKKGDIVNVVLPSYLSWVSILAVQYLGATSMTLSDLSKSKIPFLIHWNLSLKAESIIQSNRNILFNEELLEIIKKTEEFASPMTLDNLNSVVRILSTSGTTGDIKFIPYSQTDLNNLESNIGSWELYGTGNALSLYSFSSKQAYRQALKLLSQGKTIYHSSFLDYRLAKFLRENKIETVFGSPGQVSNLVDLLIQTGTKLPDLKTIIMGGSVPSARILNLIRMNLKCEIINVYGSTEVGNVGSMNLTNDNIGKFKINARINLEIVDDQDRQVEINEIGIIRYKKPSLDFYYLNNPEATSKFFRNGFFYPGDLGFLDENGFLTLTGRINEVINTGGVKINPFFVEEILNSQPGVIDSAAFSARTKSDLEILGIALVTRDGFSQSRFNENIRQKISLPNFKVFYVTEIPRNENGKINRLKLLEMSQSCEQL